MTAAFNAERSLNYTKDQLQSKNSDFKKTFTDIEQLRQVSGWSWSYVENKVTGDPTSIEEWVEANPSKKAYFRKSDIDFDKLSFLHRYVKLFYSYNIATCMINHCVRYAKIL
jgi:hypothetical protein